MALKGTRTLMLQILKVSELLVSESSQSLHKLSTGNLRCRDKVHLGNYQTKQLKIKALTVCYIVFSGPVVFS